MVKIKNRFKSFEVPYNNNSTSLLLLLPDENKSVKDLESQLNANVLNKLLKNMHHVLVQLHLPRFKFESGLNLITSLNNLGLYKMFNEDNANFSGISKQNNLFVSQIVHKAVIEMNEEGTKAAAATCVCIPATGCHPPQTVQFVVNHRVEFNANKPFMLILHLANMKTRT